MEGLIRLILIWVLSYPGTFFVWIFQRRKKSFSEVRESSSPYFHAAITSIIIGIIILIAKSFK